ncbi:MAG: TetR/AcrR family transcriptional regulator [Lachnospiraceae bacterium]|nr:TetR/AcrR family transcriptional regulator [Lachnospiraceae bacterium]
MNEKFFDLKKEKQDRMINAALKVFANAGYAHASTDDIVREAGVSKGLLFHYFTSKLGLYVFLYDYAMRYEQLEISTCVGKTETDYFVLRGQLLKAQVNCMKRYPYLSLFLDRADREENETAAKAVGRQIIQRAEQSRMISEHVELSRLKPEADQKMIGRMLSGAFRSILTDVLRLEEGAPEEYASTCEAYLSMMRQLCYTDEEQEREVEA